MRPLGANIFNIQATVVVSIQYVSSQTIKPSLFFHWMAHIYVSKLTTIGSNNGLSPGRCQAIIWTNAGILLIGPSETNFRGILIEIHTFLFKKIHFKMSSGKYRPFCLGLNMFNVAGGALHCQAPWSPVESCYVCKEKCNIANGH